MTLSEKSQRLGAFVIDNIEQMRFQLEEMKPTSLDFPSFEVTPFDYIVFAEKALKTDSLESRINCVSHLKHAIDCELDTFLHILNLDTLLHILNPKRDKASVAEKIGITGRIGVFNSRSLVKLNQIRNKMEHAYVEPEIQDLEVYSELVQAFVYALDGFMFMLAASPFMIWYRDNDWFSVHFLSSSFLYQFSSDDPDSYTEDLVFDRSDQIDDYIFAIKVFFLLCRAKHLISLKSVVSELKQMLNLTSDGASLSDRGVSRPKNVRPTSIDWDSE